MNTENVITLPAPTGDVAQQSATEKPDGMMLHCGGELVNRETVFGVATPEPTKTWYPLAHEHVITRVERQFDSVGIRITAPPAHALSHEGQRYFGLYQVSNGGGDNPDYSWVVGVRNSHDKSIPAGLVAGSRVFICDNLCISGDISFSRKHTRFAARDLQNLVSGAVGQLHDKFYSLDQRIECYKETRISDTQSHDLLVKALDARAITTTQIPKVLEEWRTPRHEAFEERNAWSLFNGFTEVYKEIKDANTMTKRSQALHGLFDSHCGIALAN